MPPSVRLTAQEGGNLQLVFLRPRVAWQLATVLIEVALTRPVEAFLLRGLARRRLLGPRLRRDLLSGAGLRLRIGARRWPWLWLRRLRGRSSSDGILLAK